MNINYLDQFVVKKAFCPVTNDPHREFFVRVGELCLQLASKRIASFPFSESHLKETALLSDSTQRDMLAEKFKSISNGYQFASALGIRIAQATAVRKGLAIDWSPRRAIFEDEKVSFREKLNATPAPDRDTHDAMLKQVLIRYQSLPKPKLDSIAAQEAGAYGKLLTQDIIKMFGGGDVLALLNAPQFRLFLDLEIEARAEGVENPVMDAYLFVQDHAMKVPSIHLESELWQDFAKAKIQTLQKESDPANTAEDIQFISSFVPYCDGAFIDAKMAARLSQSKLLHGHKTRIFSIHQRDEFIQYLSGLEKDYVPPVSAKAFLKSARKRVPSLRREGRPLLWISVVPENPDGLVRPRAVKVSEPPASLVECNILPGGGVEWVEAISPAEKLPTSLLTELINRALDLLFPLAKDSFPTCMKIKYVLVNCAGATIVERSGSKPLAIGKSVFELGGSDWVMENRSLLWPKPDEMLQSLLAK